MLDWLTKNRAETSPDNSDQSLRTQEFAASPEEILRAARFFISDNQSWNLLEESTHRLRATHKTGVIGFIDDVTVTTTPTDDGTLVDISSASRVGIGDFGQNRRNIIELLDGIKTAILDDNR